MLRIDQLMALDYIYWNRVSAQIGHQAKIGSAFWSSDCENRQRGYVDFFIVHHTASTSEAGSIAIMQPGDSRTVSAQWVLGVDGVFHPIVPLEKRAWTSASWLDDIADTVETVNATGSPEWAISDQATLALAYMAVWKFKNGRLKSLTRQHIIGHNEVSTVAPGTSYPTACPGPDMHLDLIVELAVAINRGLIGPLAPTTDSEDLMPAFYRNPSGGIVYQREPNTVLVPIDLTTWNGFAANGNKYRDVTAAEYTALVAKCGTATKPEATSGTTTVETGDVTVQIDYDALAKAIWDENARRIAG